jgi:phage minor structural protein
LIDYEIDERLFQSHTLSFKVPAPDLKTRHLVEDAMLEYEGETYFITDVIRERDEEQTLYEVHAETAWMRLADIKRPGNFTLVEQTAADGLEAILLGTIWTAQQVPTSVGTFSMDAADASILDLIWQWAKVTGNEVRFESFRNMVDLIPQVGSTKPIVFHYGRNLTGVKRTAKAPAVTRLYVYGRTDLGITNSTTGGVDYIEDYSYYTGQGISLPDAIRLYRKDEIYSDDSFIDEASLYAAGQARLAVLAQPLITYEISVLDLTRLMGRPDFDFKCGDTVRVFDSVLEIDVAARVSRKVTYPYEPARNKVELTYGAILLPDDHRVSTTRPDFSKEWELFVSRNTETLRRIREFSTILHRVQLDHVEGAEWVVGYKLMGTGVGAGTVTITPTNDTDSTPLCPPVTIDIVNGEHYEWDFTYGEKDIPVGSTIMVIRAQSSGAGVGLNIALKGTAFWILARGSTRSVVTLQNSVRYEYTGLVQSFEVPDDVHEVLIEAHGGGHPRDSEGDYGNGGKGGMVKGKFPVTSGDTYDVYVGGSDSPGASPGFTVTRVVSWPNGGTGGAGSLYGAGGGGSTHLFLNGATFTDSLLVAPGGGGDGPGYTGGDLHRGPGGHGGFYEGTDGYRMDWFAGQTPGVDLPFLSVLQGQKATQDAAGPGGPGNTPAGDGAFNQGGAGEFGGVLGQGSGGGGGGWYGGGAGDGGAGQSSGGGGGSGWFDFSLGYDFEVEDAENDDQGYMIISWDDPDQPEV